MAKLESATNVAGEEGAQSIARILNVTGDGIETVDRFGSVLVALGNNSAASEREIVRITTEIARSASAFDVGATKAAAMGAAMASLGIRAEIGGSSVGRTMQTLTNVIEKGGDELESFATKFGSTAEQMAEAFRRDSVEGLVLFLEGVQEHGQAAGAALDLVGLGGQEIAKTIIPLANNLEVLREALGLAEKEAKQATALDEEFAASLETASAQATILKNKLDVMAKTAATKVLPVLTDALTRTNEWIGDESGGGIQGLKFTLAAVGMQMDNTFGDPARSLIDGFVKTFERQMIALSSIAGETVSFIEDAFMNMPSNIKSAIEIATIEIATLFDRAKSAASGITAQSARNAKITEAQLLFQKNDTPFDIQQQILQQIR
ncbi:MAG: phage tail tape measure protein [Gammaproteobacteria bacterium]|nr:phage tail tape measure protein [Gammaproteobacteria bacterium]